MNTGGILSSFVSDYALEGLRKSVAHPGVQSHALRVAARAAGFAAGRAEYAGRSLRRTEASLYRRAELIERGEARQEPSLTQLMRECWSE